MFGTGTAAYFDRLPTLSDIDAEGARRLLSSAYADVLAERDSLSRVEPDSLVALRRDLRRLASALEVHAVLTDGVDDETYAAASFVAAEALSLLLDLPDAPEWQAGEEPEAETNPELPPVDAADHPEARYRLETQRGFHAIECGLLYLTAGFDSNAFVVARDAGTIEAPETPLGEAYWAERAYRALIALLQLFPRSPVVVQPEPDLTISATEPTEVRVRSAIFRRIERAASDHLRWLSFETQRDDEPPAERIESLAALLRDQPSPRYADLAQLVVLLGKAIETTTRRALRTVPSTGSDVFDAYIRVRAADRPVVWPSTAQYARACLPGPSANAVVALPTGSGKSFTAELAAAQALETGWVLYLVPTNALAAQVRRDLGKDLAGLDGTRVRAFLGDGQYTELGEESVAGVGPGAVLVMTPEKCALALRRAPEAFENLRLCVLDECHQLGDTGGRGAIAELVLSHVMTVAPGCRLLLMSALVSNAEELSEWLLSATGTRSEPISNPWRPTRTLRALVGFHAQSSQAALEHAQQQLSNAGRHRKNWKFAARYALVANLQGAWTDNDERNYVSLTLPVDGKLQWHRDPVGPGWRYGLQAPSGYVNNVVGDLTTHFAASGEKVLAFLPASRHHPFAVAENLDLRGTGASTHDPADEPRLDALLTIADWELGVPSVLRDVLRRGAAVHTSSLVDAERQAAETAFRQDRVAVMLATGTLAQGLNLPATMVIVGGTDVGDRRESRTGEGRIKSLAQLVNAIGRAGRANVASRSAALVVPSAPMLIRDDASDIDAGLSQAEVLSREDAAMSVSSPLEALVAAALAGPVSREGMSLDELTAFTYLPITETSGPSASSILSRSLGVWRRQPNEPEDAATVVARALRVLGHEFLETAGVPEWTAAAATRSGRSLPEIFAIYRAIERLLDHPRETLSDWLGLFGEVVKEMPPDLGRAALNADKFPAGARFSILKSPVITPAEWQAGWAALYAVMRRHWAGQPLSEVARTAFDLEGDVSPGRSDGAKPLPKIIGLVDRASYALSMTAGALTAVFAAAEEAEAGERWSLSDQGRLSLEMLPLAIRNGCGDVSSLSWFRFCIRQRRAAHLLASLMPVPDRLATDAQVESWVSDRRDRWLEAGQLELPADAPAETERVLAAALVVAAGDRTS